MSFGVTTYDPMVRVLKPVKALLKQHPDTTGYNLRPDGEGTETSRIAQATSSTANVTTYDPMVRVLKLVGYLVKVLLPQVLQPTTRW